MCGGGGGWKGGGGATSLDCIQVFVSIPTVLLWHRLNPHATNAIKMEHIHNKFT